MAGRSGVFTAPDGKNFYAHKKAKEYAEVIGDPIPAIEDIKSGKVVGVLSNKGMGGMDAGRRTVYQNII